MHRASAVHAMLPKAPLLASQGCQQALYLMCSLGVSSDLATCILVVTLHNLPDQQACSCLLQQADALTCEDI